jgi:hypothetical protein
MTPSVTRQKQVCMRRVSLAQKRAHRLGQVIEINLLRRELAGYFLRSRFAS